MDESSPNHMGSDIEDPLIGTVLDNRYRILERLASGGMGVVYRGERIELQRPVAIKFLHEGVASNSDSMKRFKREALTMSRLTHPNCVGVIDIGIGAGSPYIVMDYVTGRTLEDVLERAGEVPPGRAIFLVSQVLAALSHAHSHDLVHRDIKPANIMLSNVEGTVDHVFVLDFGLAKFSNMAGNDITGASMLVGTPSYMSPEQTRGETVGPASDVYSTGVLLYELLTGKKPFDAANPLETLYMHRDAPIPKLRELAPDRWFSEDLENVVKAALAKQPEQRFASAAAFATALDAVPEASTYTPPRVAAPSGKSSAPAGKKVRVNERLAFASTQPVSTLELELRDKEARARQASTPAPDGGEVGRAPTPLALDAVTETQDAPTRELGPPARTGRNQPSSVPPRRSRSRAGVLFALVAMLSVGLVIWLVLASAGDDQRSASSADDANAASSSGDERGAFDAGRASGSTSATEPDPDASHGALDAAPPQPEPIVVKRAKDVETLIDQGRTEEAIDGIKKLLGTTHKNNPYLLYRLGNLYFEQGDKKSALSAYRKSLLKERKYRSYASINENIIECLADNKVRRTANSLYLRVIKRSGLKYLKKASVEHENPVVRKRANWLHNQLSSRRKR